MTNAPAFVLDGAAIADETLVDVAGEARALIARGVKPGLAVVIVGDDPASQTYVGAKSRTAKECGFHSIQHTLPGETTEESCGAGRGAQRRSGRQRHPGAIAAAQAPDSAAIIEPSRPKRTSTDFTSSMSASLPPATPAAPSSPARLPAR